MLDRVAEERGYPRRIRSDNGPELVGKTITICAATQGVKPVPFEPGNPTKNGYAGRFNRTCRAEELDVPAYSDLAEVSDESTRGLYVCSHDRTRQALNPQPPAANRGRYASTRNLLAEREDPGNL